jgi:hypothetical protein
MSAREWVLGKLRVTAERQAEAPDLPPPPPEKPKPRYKLAAGVEKPAGPPCNAPYGTPQSEWDAAVAAVAAGSAPSTLKYGCDIPNSTTARMMGRSR